MLICGHDKCNPSGLLVISDAISGSNRSPILVESGMMKFLSHDDVFEFVKGVKIRGERLQE